MAQQDKLGVYISVPFCRAKCSFCNFASGVSSPEAIDRYVAELCCEMDRAADTGRSLGTNLPLAVDTVYLGGGTPSLLTPEQLRSLFGALRRNFDVQHEAEVTLEAAPGQIAECVLDEALGLGVNRVSLGVQSFADRESAAVGRSHTGESCVAEIARLRACGVPDVGADLIAGLPYQTDRSWEESLQTAAEAELTHLSVYMLEVDDESRLGREMLSGGLRLHAPRVPNEEQVADMYEQACALLPLQGIAQYEISNFARSGFESKHNRKYWERKPYMGFGLDAHSMLGRCDGSSVRFANPDGLADYSNLPGQREVTDIGLRDAFEEHVFLTLRLIRGLDVEELRANFPRDWVNEVSMGVKELSAEGLMEAGDNVWRLTLRGRLLSSEVFGHLLARVPA